MPGDNLPNERALRWCAARAVAKSRHRRPLGGQVPWSGVDRVAPRPPTQHNGYMADQAWTDEALHSGTEDGLGRLPYARRAAELIHSTHSFDSSAVFGLSGPWGSGKTSLVNMIVEELVKAHPKWAVARFTPWATSDVAGLLGEFYSSLVEVLPKKRGQQVRRALAITASVAAPAAKLIPIAGDVAAEGVRAAGEALAKSTSWQVAFNKASHKLRELEQPILIVVDDIDRLHGEELMALLKVVRLLGRFDGVQYLLAYDDETLYRSLTASRSVNPPDGSAERFMEKIVQYPLFVPPLLRHQQLARLSAGIAGVSREYIEGGASERRLSGLVDCFTSLLTTPRSIDRYVAQLRHHLPLLPADEVDDEDVQLLTLIRVCFPALFNSIPRCRSELISGHTGEMKSGSGQMGFESFGIEPLLAVVTKDLRSTARQLLVSLFPKIRSKTEFSVYESHRRQSVQHEEYFDRYFAMGILDHDVSDVTVAKAVAAATGGNSDDLAELLLADPDDLHSLVLSKATIPTNQPSSDEGRIQLAQVLAGISNQLPSDDHSPFSDQDQILSWIAGLLAALDKNTPAKVVLHVIESLQGSSLRIRAWERLRNAIETGRPADVPPWYAEAAAQLVKDSTESFLEHLKLGDDAEEATGVGYQIHFVLRHDAEGLRTRVHELLESKDSDVSVVASRLVSVRTRSGVRTDWQLSREFDQETFNQVAPPGDDPWYDEPVKDVDPRDLSWANRRRFAAGRVSPPPLSPAVPEA